MDAQTRASIENALSDLRDAIKTDDADMINRKIEALTAASHKLAEVIYSQAAAEHGKTEGYAGGPGAGDGGKGPNDDVVDAEFEEVKK